MASILNVDQINNAAGTTALTIDSTGRILTPARPAFSVTQIEASGSASQTGHYTWNTVNTNVGSYWSTSNNRFEVPVDGFYSFSFSGLGCISTNNPITSGSYGHVGIQKSTDSGSSWSTLCIGYEYATGTSLSFHPNLSCSVGVTLNAGDYVRLYVLSQYVYSNTAATAFNPTFSGFLVG